MNTHERLQEAHQMQWLSESPHYRTAWGTSPTRISTANGCNGSEPIPKAPSDDRHSCGFFAESVDVDRLQSAGLDPAGRDRPRSARTTPLRPGWPAGRSAPAVSGDLDHTSRGTEQCRRGHSLHLVMKTSFTPWVPQGFRKAWPPRHSMSPASAATVEAGSNPTIKGTRRGRG
jgi:hypothetical protein